MSYQSPLNRARGLGAAKTGVAHWWMQRLTSIAMVPLVAWLMASFALCMPFEYTELQQWLAQPVHTVLLLCFVCIFYYHSTLGLQVVAEDYIASEWKRRAVIVFIIFINFLMAVISIFALLKISLGTTT